MEYYNSLCMKTVNQTVGRAVRHRNDYSSIILLDKRFKGTVVDSMPSWVVRDIKYLSTKSSVRAELTTFFSKMATKYTCKA